MATDNMSSGGRPTIARARNGETDWNPGLMETLYSLLYRIDLGSDQLDAELEKMEKLYGEEVYAELVHLLSHLRYSPREAKQHWLQVLSHRDEMSERFGGKIDLRVALVSYFVEVNKQLTTPKIIELKLFEQTQASVYRDDLTGLCNFRYFREHLAREIHRSFRNRSPISLVMIDIDNFKMYNDRNGHEEGNEILKLVANLIQDSLRTVDVAARYGGEEFAMILPGTAKIDAESVAERVRARIEKHDFPDQKDQPDGTLTISLGVATYPADAEEPDKLVRRADSALYFAKSNGKNQVHLFGQNRRSYDRVEAKLEGSYQALSSDVFPLTTMDISEGGLLFLIDRNMPIGSLLKIRVRLPEDRKDVRMAARVVRVENTETGIFQIGVRILEILAADWCLLSKFVHDNQGTSEDTDTTQPLPVGSVPASV